MTTSATVPSIASPPPFREMIPDAEQRAAEQAPSITPHVCTPCACRPCGRLPSLAPEPPKCVGDERDHERHRLYWVLVRTGQRPSAELARFADEFESRVNDHFTSLEPVGEDWSVREVEW